MSEPSVSGPSAPRRPHHPVVVVLLILIGIVLLLPGLCSLGFVLLTVRDLSGAGEFVFLWLITFVVAAGGILLIRYAVRGRQ
jgi:hypothetical protein